MRVDRGVDVEENEGGEVNGPRVVEGWRDFFGVGVTIQVLEGANRGDRPLSTAHRPPPSYLDMQCMTASISAKEELPNHHRWEKNKNGSKKDERRMVGLRSPFPLPFEPFIICSCQLVCQSNLSFSRHAFLGRRHMHGKHCHTQW